MSKKNKLKKVAITGPESTGKSFLAQQLADYYRTVWVPEFARVYLLRQDGKYNYEDILEIARGQWKSEKALARLAHKLYFVDTELLVNKIWSDVKFGKCHSWILHHLDEQQYDLYLLMDIDLPWEPDPMREHPEKRQFLFDLYENELKSRGMNYHIVSGLDDERFKNALALVDDILKSE